jgi:hypothetical protein
MGYIFEDAHLEAQRRKHGTKKGGSVMETTANAILKGVMTQKEIDESHAKLATIGAEGSQARKIAFDLMKLAESIRQANIPNQDFYYETAHFEQFAFHLHAFKKVHGLENAKIRDGLNWLKEQGLLEQSFAIPDCLETMRIRARCKVLDRKQRLEKAVKDAQDGKKSGKQSATTDWGSVRGQND